MNTDKYRFQTPGDVGATKREQANNTSSKLGRLIFAFLSICHGVWLFECAARHKSKSRPYEFSFDMEQRASL